MAAGSDTKPSDGTAGATDIGNSSRTGGVWGGSPDLRGDNGVTNDEDGRTIPLPDLDRLTLAGGSGSGGGRRAVRLVQTVAAAQTPYRYAAVLHFWDLVSDTDKGG